MAEGKNKVIETRTVLYNERHRNAFSGVRIWKIKQFSYLNTELQLEY